MTIIAVDARAGTMVADTLVTQGEGHVCHTAKIVRGLDGSLLGAAGQADQCLRFLRWAVRGFKGKAPCMDEITGVQLTPERALRVFIGGPEAEDALDTVLAFGSGKDAFLGAHFAGAGIGPAAAIACSIDPSCGLPLTFLHLEDRT